MVAFRLETASRSQLPIVKHGSDQGLAHFIETIRIDRPMEKVVDTSQDNFKHLSRNGYLGKERLINTELIFLAFRRFNF